tara:strand:+ start:184 stop:414 length:231 start_codon:yes stop_codon:yes gene_type:complete
MGWTQAAIAEKQQLSMDAFFKKVAEMYPECHNGELDWESLKEFDDAAEKAITAFRDVNDPERRINRGLVNVVPKVE